MDFTHGHRRFTPLLLTPEPLRIVALFTPFSYPAEVLRYSIGISATLLPLPQMFIIGYTYALTFLSFGIALFNYGLRKILKEGVKASPHGNLFYPTLLL